MGFLDFLKRWFKSDKEDIHDKPKENIKKKSDNMKAKTNKLDVDKNFHPEILFLINRPYAEYVDFIEIK